MGFLKNLFGGRAKKPPSLSDPEFAPFLQGWGFELRSSQTPIDEVVAQAAERFFEHFPDDFPEPTAGRLIHELQAWTERFIAEERVAEASWSAATDNDRLTAAFEALAAQDLVAREDAGVSIQDGWGEVGVHQRRAHLGAVFFHQQDVLDALRGEELLLAFGAFEERPDAPSHEAIGHKVTEALAAHGFAPSWSGDGRERIRLGGFAWKKRRWTPSPPVPSNPVATLGPSPLEAEKRHVPDALRAIEAGPFVQRVTAVASSAGFNVQLAETFEALWRQHGGARGQLCHVGPPHIFVPAGEQTDLGVRNAYLNLEPAEASAVRRRGRRAVIARERSSAVRAVPWGRSLWAAGGGPGQIGLLVLSSEPLTALVDDDSPVDWFEWSPYAEVPDGFTCVYRDRRTEPERFTSVEAAALMAHEHTTSGPGLAVLEHLAGAQYGAMVQSETRDPSDLGYVQFGWAVARWLLGRRDGVVLDTLAGRWWTRDELVSWEAGGFPTGRRFRVDRELQFTSGLEGDQWLLGTQGMSKFGRPEVQCSVNPEHLDTKPEFATASIPGWGPEVLNTFATRLALGALAQPGEAFQFGSMTFKVESSEGTLTLVPQERIG